jgi:PIN domain nuclease of toxin-antitoxin system
LPIRFVPFEASTAELAARLEPATRPLGLSLGDRACLALAVELGVPALTADRDWASLEIGVDVVLVR